MVEHRPRRRSLQHMFEGLANDLEFRCGYRFRPTIELVDHARLTKSEYNDRHT